MEWIGPNLPNPRHEGNYLESHIRAGKAFLMTKIHVIFEQKIGPAIQEAINQWAQNMKSRDLAYPDYETMVTLRIFIDDRIRETLGMKTERQGRNNGRR